MIYAFIIIASIALDRGVKLWAADGLKAIGDIPVIENIFHLTYAENTGAAFGMMSGWRVLLIGVPILCIGAMIYLLATNAVRHRVGRLAMAFIVAGAIGNLIDRILFGYVVDMFYFKLINFAVFNVADTFISLGAVLLFIYLIFQSEMFKRGNSSEVV